jgi:MraZ protein
MSLFLSTYRNKIDAKGRVSVTAPFRAVLSNQAFHGIIAYPSFIHPAIEGCSMHRIEQMSQSIESLDPFSDKRDAFATTILGSSMQLAFDKDGRIILPEPLIETAQLKKEAVFLGKGTTFEIWEPTLFENYLEKARTHAKQERESLRFSYKGSNS